MRAIGVPEALVTSCCQLFSIGGEQTAKVQTKELGRPIDH
jgi:hypothetical protein